MALTALAVAFRSAKGSRDIRVELDELISKGPSFEIPKSKGAEIPRELLVAWVQFLRADIMEAVNTLHNRLNVINNSAAVVTSGDLTPEQKQALDRIQSESARAAKITAGLLHRVHSLTPDTVPPVLFEYDGSKIPTSRILLVENDEANRTVIGQLLERLGQKVTTVTNGFEAFSELERDGADCIICDVKLPYLDGRTLFEQVEGKKPHLASKFVFVTGDFANPETLDFLRNTGQPYVAKPYELESLLGAVVAILRSRTSQDLEPKGAEHKEP